MAEKKSKSVDYRSCFKGEDGKSILADLNRFCFGTRGYLDTTKKLSTSEDGHSIVGVSQIDALEMARFEGRREVLIYILTQCKLDSIDIIDEFLEDEMEGF